MKKQTTLTILITAMITLASVTQAFAGSALLDGPPTETPTPTVRSNPATQKASLNATRQAARGNGGHEHLIGTVTALDQTNLTIAYRDGSSQTIIIDERTRTIFADPEGIRSGGIHPGNRVMVQAYHSGDTLIAKTVLVMQGKPTRAHHVGAVIEYVPGVKIVVQNKNGLTRTFMIDATTQILPPDRADQLAVGQQVTVVAAPSQGRKNERAIGIVILPASQ